MVVLKKAEQLFPFHHAAGKADIQQTKHILDRQGFHPVGKGIERAGHIGAPYQCANGCSRHHLWLHTDIFQRLDDPDMRPATGGTTA